MTQQAFVHSASSQMANSIQGQVRNMATWLWFVSFTASGAFAEEHAVHSFERQRLTGVYFSEGAHAGDFNHDGIPDVTYGPYWYEGPDFKTQHEIREPIPQDVNRYADHFFSWAYDFNQDGYDDIFAVGFCGTPAHVYENPGAGGGGKHWRKHEVIDWVSNESPQFTDIVGDDRPELICTRDSMFGFATIDWDDPFGAWEFHPISTQIAAKKFGHGLGVGDVNGDGRNDVLFKDGWLEQPEKNVGTSRWMLHATSFSLAGGGAEMYAYDVDGDGDNDIITSHSAHNFGLGWYEQLGNVDGEIAFKHHLIVGSHPSENKYGVLFSEPHSLALADMDGDGLKDIITGKTYWSHHKQSPMWDAGAVVYWFKLVRGKEGIDWLPYMIDGESGIGRQVTIVDLNSDQLPDVVVGGMKGAHVLLHRQVNVAKDIWAAAQPKVYDGPKLESSDAVVARGPQSSIDAVTGRVDGAIEGESLKTHVSAGRTRPQNMKGFQGDRWSNDSQMWWTGAQPGSVLTFDLPEFTGDVDLEVVMTTAKDYGIVQLSLDDQTLGKPIDLYSTGVGTTGVLHFPKLKTKGKRHTLSVLMVGANLKAVRSYMFALDYLRIRPSDGD